MTATKPKTSFVIPKTPRLDRLASVWARSPKPRRQPLSEPNHESVWDYPRPPAVELVSVRVQVFVADRCVADSRRCLRVLETASPPSVYFHPEDVDRNCLQPEQGGSFCEWKGHALYYTVTHGKEVCERAAWSYLDPYAEYSMLGGYLSFYPGRVSRCLYDGEVVRPQPGQFYGGWLTSNLAGPFKGEPGSGGW